MFWKATRNSAETAQSLYRKEEHTIVERYFASTAKNPTRQETKKYIIEFTIKNKMSLYRCDAYPAKETLGYRERKTYVAATKGPAKREGNQRGTSGEINLQTNNQSSPMRRREQPMAQQNSINKEKESKTQRQETEEVARREKVGEGAIRNGKTRRDCHQTKTSGGKRHTRKRWTRNND